MNEIVKKAQQLPSLQQDDPYLRTASRVASNVVFLKFIKGAFYYGTDKTELPLGTELVPNIEESKIGWLKWWGGEVVDDRMEYFSKGSYAFRDDLGDLDRELWEVDEATGKARDCWQETATFPAKSPATGQEFVFTTQSDGGRKAVAKLVYDWRFGLSQGKADLLPIIKIGKGGYNHKIKSVGWVDTPTFTIVRWVDEADLISGEGDSLPEDDLDDLPFD